MNFLKILLKNVLSCSPKSIGSVCKKILFVKPRWRWQSTSAARWRLKSVFELKTNPRFWNFKKVLYKPVAKPAKPKSAGIDFRYRSKVFVCEAPADAVMMSKSAGVALWSSGKYYAKLMASINDLRSLRRTIFRQLG